MAYRKPNKTISTKISYSDAGKVMQLAGDLDMTISGYIKYLIGREFSGENYQAGGTLDEAFHKKEVKELEKKIELQNKEIKSLRRYKKNVSDDARRIAGIIKFREIQLKRGAKKKNVKRGDGSFEMFEAYDSLSKVMNFIHSLIIIDN